MKIFINPGHTPQRDIDSGLDWDVGAAGLFETENVIAAEVANLIAQECKNYGILVVGNFQSMSLYDITDTANATDADIFVSIHCNSASPSAKGTETFYCQGSSTGKKIAECVQKHIIADLHTVDRGVKDDTLTQHKRIHVLRQSNMPAILIELAFISNPDDAALVRDHKLAFAKAIVKGLAEYAGIDLPAPDIIDAPADLHADINKIAFLSRKYESKGDPACVANNLGDLGGISYGLYQFASNVGVVDKFVNWLSNYPDPALANYGKTLASHNVNSDAFINQWKLLGSVDPGNFANLQDEFVKSQYFDLAAKILASDLFHIDNHSDALKAVLFSRSVQNGVSGSVNLFNIASKRLGHPNLSYVDSPFFDRDLINSIYDFLISECDLAKPDNDGIWRSPDNFCHGSNDIILSLRNRFVNECADALHMLH